MQSFGDVLRIAKHTILVEPLDAANNYADECFSNALASYNPVKTPRLAKSRLPAQKNSTVGATVFDI